MSPSGNTAKTVEARRFELQLRGPRGARWVVAEGVNAVTAASAVLSVDERVVASRSLKPLSKPVPARGGKFDVRVFTTRLLALLDAGLNVTESLEALSARAANSGSEVIARLLRSVREGSGFSRALEREYAE